MASEADRLLAGQILGEKSGLRAGLLNAHCRCEALNRKLLGEAFAHRGIAGEARESLLAARPHLFSETMVFLSPEQLASLSATIAAIETLVALPGWQQTVLAKAPETARQPARTRGVFIGYDFHVGEGEPQLIEVNTNAGGAYLAALLTRSQLACCEEIAALMQAPTDPAALEELWLAMFREEWRLARGAAPLGHVVIVDEAPAAQFLYPEFLLFQNLFERAGLRARIAAPEELVWRDGQLTLGGETVDLIYNRLTDFYFASPSSAALRAAYLADAVVVTPDPRAHALLSDKRHLVRLGDPQSLAGLGLGEAERAQLARGVPRAKTVHPAEAESLWAERKGFFFKPANGFGSRAAYRGDKLTRRVWGEILAGDYVAQRIAPPSLRRTGHGDATRDLKFDVRAYVYQGRIQLLAARLYEGQTTNFRTPGGGFAPVFIAPPDPDA